MAYKKKLPLLINQNLGSRDFTISKKDFDFKNNVLKNFGNSITNFTANKKILIFTRQSDKEIDSIGPLLIKNDIDYIRINADSFFKNFDFSIKIPSNPTDKFSITFNFNGINYNLEDFNFIWIRHFSKESFFIKHKLDPTIKKYLTAEWGELFDAIFELNSKKSLAPMCRIISKPLQLIEAKKVGLLIPETIITNSKQDFSNHFQKYHGKIFAKALKHHSLYKEDGTVVDYYGRSFDSKELILLENMESAPVIYQNLLDKKHSQEYRLNVFGQNISSFTYEGIETDDWHLEDISGIKMKKAIIPDEIKNKVLQLFNNLNIDIGTVDLIKLNNNWYFLEINLGGDWRWLEIASGEDLSPDVLNMWKFF